MKYAFIQDHAKRWPAVHMCRLLGVKRNSYYDWRKRPAKVIPAEELILRRRMKALFAASRESLGIQTMKEKMREEGSQIDRERTRKLMKVLRPQVKQKRKYKVTTDSKHRLPIAENMLDRQFLPLRPIERGERTSRTYGPRKVGCTWQW